MCIAWKKLDNPITLWAWWSPLFGPINVLHVAVLRGGAFAACQYLISPSLGTHMKIAMCSFNPPFWFCLDVEKTDTEIKLRKLSAFEI